MWQCESECCLSYEDHSERRLFPLSCFESAAVYVFSLWNKKPEVCLTELFLYSTFWPIIYEYYYVDQPLGNYFHILCFGLWHACPFISFTHTNKLASPSDLKLHMGEFLEHRLVFFHNSFPTKFSLNVELKTPLTPTTHSLLLTNTLLAKHDTSKTAAVWEEMFLTSGF